MSAMNHHLPASYRESSRETSWATSVRIAVVIPCYRVKKHILTVLSQIGPEVTAIYVVDDACPTNSGVFVQENCKDPRVRVLFNAVNQGVGGATITGYKQAVQDEMDVIVKIDGDGQMDPTLILDFVAPVAMNLCDYSKGNRFFDLQSVEEMPVVRKIGNLGLSFLTKLSSGYWHIFDPTNGYTAIHASMANAIPLEKLDKRYFFESDLLFRIGILGGVVIDVPMKARYRDEKSGLSASKEFFRFLSKNLRNTAKRIAYVYFLRDFNIASIELVLGSAFVVAGAFFGILRWIFSIEQTRIATAGTVMLAALPIIIGTQLLISFMNFDMSRNPRVPLPLGQLGSKRR